MREIRIVLSAEHSCTLAVEDPDTPLPQQLHACATIAPREWQQFGLPLAGRSIAVLQASFELDGDHLLVLRDPANLFVYLHCEQPHLLVQMRSVASLLAAQCVEECAPAACHKRTLMDRLNRERRESNRLILSRTQSAMESATPRQRQQPSSGDAAAARASQSDECAGANKDRLKRYMLYELGKAGIARDSPEFSAFWKSLYANCQFQLRREIGAAHLKREVLFNCVRSNLRALLHRSEQC